MTVLHILFSRLLSIHTWLFSVLPPILCYLLSIHTSVTSCVTVSRLASVFDRLRSGLGSI